MKLKTFSLLALTAVLAFVFVGCAQDSTDPTNENPAMQEQVKKGATGAAGADQSSTNPSSSEAKGGSGGTKIALAADPTGALKYDKKQLNANAGDITIDLANKSSVPHDVEVETTAGKSLGASEEITQSNTSLALKGVKAGTYTFFCTVPGHRQAGMEGTLTVK